MEDIISKIISVENQARKMVADAEEKKAMMEQDFALKDKESELRAELNTKVKEKIDSIVQRNHEEAEKAIAEGDAAVAAQMARMREIFTIKKDEWVDMLFNKVVEL